MSDLLKIANKFKKIIANTNNPFNSIEVKIRTEMNNLGIPVDFYSITFLPQGDKIRSTILFYGKHPLSKYLNFSKIEYDLKYKISMLNDESMDNVIYDVGYTNK